jgi:hypothetical protein
MVWRLASSVAAVKERKEFVARRCIYGNQKDGDEDGAWREGKLDEIKNGTRRVEHFSSGLKEANDDWLYIFGEAWARTPGNSFCLT